jgi:L-ascorbate metabolism protein UlaG (beta-lactamase superfamily)
VTEHSGVREHRRPQPRPSRLKQAPEAARFLRKAAPAFFRRISEDYSRGIEPAPLRPRPKLWPDVGLHAAWLGHSTVLLKIDGFTILTDPVFGPRVGLHLGPMTVGLKRLVEVAAPLGDLPPIDLVLLSHAHMDHFDLPSLRLLENARTQVVTASCTSDLLRPKRYARVQELRWDESAQAGAAKISAFEVAHWGARVRGDTYRGYNGYVIEVGGRRLIFGGDTAYTDNFRRQRSSKRVDLAIMPIGAYDPWIRVHCNPEEAWRMANDAGAEFILPVHHQTFQLSREPRLEPIHRILQAAGSDADRVCLRTIGQEFHL